MAQESSHASVGKTVGKSKTLSAFVCDLDLRWKPTTTFFFSFGLSAQCPE